MLKKILVPHWTLKEEPGAFLTPFCKEREKGREEGNNNLPIQIPPFSLILMLSQRRSYVEYSFNLEK